MSTSIAKGGATVPTDDVQTQPNQVPATDSSTGRKQSDPQIELIGVRKSFVANKRRFVALEDVNMSAAPGEFVAVVGPSGCGKSTLLTMLSGLARADVGSVKVLGKEVTSTQKDVGFIFQRDALLPWRTALQNVSLPLQFRGARKRDANDKARDWLNRVGLAKFAASYPHQLSGGMRKRVSIAATMAYEPKLLLMDEPFSALDVETRTLMENDLLGWWEITRPTVVFITHDLSEAVNLADRVVVMSAGPGHVIGEYTIDLPRPRDLLQLRFDETAVALQERLWQTLRAEVVKTYTAG